MQSILHTPSPPQLFHMKSRKEYRCPPRPDALKPGMIVFAPISMDMAITQTSRARQSDLLFDDQGDNYTLSLNTRPPSTTANKSTRNRTFGSGHSKYRGIPCRPCVILFVGKPNSDHVIMAPITSRRGYHLDHEKHGSRNMETRQMFYPIPQTMTHLVVSLRGAGVVWQDWADIPLWMWRDRNGKANRSPQYLAIGALVCCQARELRGFAWECFYLTEEWTNWCQRESLGFMSDVELDELGLVVEWKRIHSNDVD